MKQYLQVTYLWRVLDETMSGEPMARKVTNKINGKLTVHYSKNTYYKRASQNALQCSYSATF